MDVVAVPLKPLLQGEVSRRDGGVSFFFVITNIFPRYRERSISSLQAKRSNLSYMHLYATHRLLRYFFFGSIISRRPSPSILYPSAVRSIATPGKKESHHANIMLSLPDVRMFPQEGVGG